MLYNRCVCFGCLGMWRCAAAVLREELYSRRAHSPAHWVLADNVALEAMRGSWGNNWHWSDQSATQDDLRTPAGRNPIIAATDSDRWVQSSAPPQHKSRAIEVTGEEKQIPPLDKFTAHVRFCFLHSPHLQTPVFPPVHCFWSQVSIVTAGFPGI